MVCLLGWVDKFTEALSLWGNSRQMLCELKFRLFKRYWHSFLSGKCAHMMLEVLVTRFELFWVHLWGPDIISSGKSRTIPMIIEQISAIAYSSWRSGYYRGVGRDVLQIDSNILRAVDMYGIRCILVVRLHTRIAHCRLMLRGVGPTGAYLHSWIVFFTWYLWASSCLLFIQVHDKTCFLGNMLLF